MARQHIEVPKFPPLSKDTSISFWVNENLPLLTSLNEAGLPWRAIGSALRSQGIDISDGTLSGTIALLRKGVVTAQNRKRTSQEANTENTDLEKLIGELKMENIGQATQNFASDIWHTADILRGAGIKESEWPSYMMPFLALMLIESRIIRAIRAELADGDIDIEELKEAIVDANFGYHEGIVSSKGIGNRLADITRSDTEFEKKLNEWLDEFDAETRELLGHIPSSRGHGEDYLGIAMVIGKLGAKDGNLLYPYVSAWANIDLTEFNNSEITTLEEHIKRKWADISAETAGEQYTPNDIIQLVSELITDRVTERGQDNVSVYDMTCGGGNFLFGVDDTLNEAFNYPDSAHTLSVRTFGQEINSSLYALAKIESRFRPRSRIALGNTMTNDNFRDEKFDYIVANPPYGVDWKILENDINADSTERFPKVCRPPTSDGQMLFMQHAFSHLSNDGMAFIVHSGSTLFSGDAGGGESEWRRKLVQEDALEAIIQLPKNEFFNTGISTYLWVLNKRKPDSRKGKILMINAETLFTKLKKNLNMKNCELASGNRETIRNIFSDFETGEFSKVILGDDILYNKVEIEITRQDDTGLSFGKAEKVAVGDRILVIDDEMAFPFDQEGFCLADGTPKEVETRIKEASKNASKSIAITSSTWDVVRLDIESGRITILGDGNLGVNKGRGALSIKPKITKKAGTERVTCNVEINSLIEKDFETIPFNSDEAANEQGIQDFLTKWVREPWSVRGKKVGCEINFNRLFPKKSEIRTVAEINKDIAALNAEIAELEAEFNRSLGV